MAELSVARPLRLFAPAKVNLGLEVLRRRTDGFHDIVSVLQAVSLFDEILITPSAEFEFHGDPRVPASDDLALSAVRSFEHLSGLVFRARVRIRKRIPIAAGLGGGSSDAGTLLAALCAMARLSNIDCHDLAASLGSDVPFFLRGGTALARGTGTEIERLPVLCRTWFVIVSPRVVIPNKTATLYQGLQADDFSTGDETRQIVAQIRRHHPVPLEMMRNPFARALYAEPSIEATRRALLDSGAPFVLPSGAGPSLFTVVESWDAASRLVARLRGEGFDVVACTNLGSGVNDARIARVALDGP